MPKDKPQVLIAGATGRLGQKIVRELKKRAIPVRALVRPGSGSTKSDAREALQNLGASIVEGDLSDRGSLLAACRGAQVVISAVNGPANIALSGQLALIEAAEEAGVERFIPSDYSLDFFKLKRGDNVFLDYRIEVAERLKSSRLQATHLLNGGFMEVIYSPFFRAVDQEKARVRFWGDGETRIDLSTLDDTAAYAAEVVLSEEAVGQVVKVAGDSLSAKEIAATLARAQGRPWAFESLGTVDGLKAHIEETRAKNPQNPLAYVFAQYQWAMVSGLGKLDPLWNDRFPEVQPTRLADFLRSGAPTPAPPAR